MTRAAHPDTASGPLGVALAELAPFQLTPPPFAPPSPMDFTIAELLRRFGGRVVRQTKPGDGGISVEVLDPEEVSREVEPEWERHGFRGRVGKLLWGRGLRKKAIRFVSCNKCARPGVCSRYPEDHKFFIPNGCELVFCKECADESRRELLLDYWHVVCNAVLESAAGREEHARLSAVLCGPDSSEADRKGAEKELGELWRRVGTLIREKGWVLARINVTLRSDGSEITGERVKRFNHCVRKLMRETVGSCKGFGMLFVDEVGFETRGRLPDSQRVAHGLNLHCHGLYFGPRLNWVRTRDLWMEVTKKEFDIESRGFYITAVKHFDENPGRAIRWALNHMFKYVSKPPAVAPGRLASLIAAFDGARRVHSLGLFYGKKPEREKKDCLCPKCKVMGVVSAVGFEGRSLPNGGCVPRLEQIDILIARGYVPLREAGRVAALSAGVSREESWGASP